MIWWLRVIIHRALLIFLFLVSFAIDVKVRAEVATLPESKTLEQEPLACWQNDQLFPCAVRTSAGERAKLKWGENQITLSESTLLVRTSARSVRVLEGLAWFIISSPVFVDSEFGQIHSDEGEFWITRARDRLTVASVRSPVWLLPRGFENRIENRIEVSPGLENWIGRVLPIKGQAQTGVPVAIALKPHLKRWSRLYDGKLSAFQKDAEEFYDRWSVATKAAAEIHEELFRRRMASIDRDEAIKVEQRQRVQKRTDELVRLFRSKVLDP